MAYCKQYLATSTASFTSRRYASLNRYLPALAHVRSDSLNMLNKGVRVMVMKISGGNREILTSRIRTL